MVYYQVCIIYNNAFFHFGFALVCRFDHSNGLTPGFWGLRQTLRPFVMSQRVDFCSRELPGELTFHLGKHGPSEFSTAKDLRRRDVHLSKARRLKERSSEMSARKCTGSEKFSTFFFFPFCLPCRHPAVRLPLIEAFRSEDV